MYTFAADSEKLDQLATELDGNIAIAVNDEIDKTYNNIGDFGDDWSGETYSQFVSGCEAYRGALNTIPTVLGNFATAFRNAAGGVDGLKGEVDSAIKTIS